MSKWKVERSYLTVLEMWHWEVIDNEGHFWGGYSTHAEAMQEADRAARTVEVVLPRVTDRTVIPQREDMGMGINWSILAGWDSRGGKIDMSGPYGGMYVYQQDLERLGAYLLALSRRKEQT